MTKINFLKTACVLCLMALFSLSINAQNRTMIGDVDGSTEVDINDVTVLINYVLTGDETGVDMAAADIAIDGAVDINDVTALINYILTGEMPYTLPEHNLPDATRRGWYIHHGWPRRLSTFKALGTPCP